MLPHFRDIRDVAKGTIPFWWDINGTPRYAPFNPEMLGVYDDKAALFEASCQDCAQRFLVGDGWDRMGLFMRVYDHKNWEVARLVRGGEYTKARELSMKKLEIPTLEEIITNFGYGDPPTHGCVGDTMGCWVLRCVEAWEYIQDENPKTFRRVWVRRLELEIDLPDKEQADMDPRQRVFLPEVDNIDDYLI